MRIKFYTDRPFGIKVQRWLIDQGEKIVKTKPNLIISCYNPRIISKEELTVPAINFHPGYLPLNRGMYPHIWPLVDGSQAGVTIHYINDKLDAGDIIGQKKVRTYPTDIASDLEKRTQDAIFDLFKELWPKIKRGKVKTIKQKGNVTYHLASEIKTIQEFDKSTIDRLRACTFINRSYGYFMDKGKRYYIGIKFFKKEDITKFDRTNHA